MIRKTLTILSLIGLLLSVGLWGVSFFWSVIWLSSDCTIRVEYGHGGLLLAISERKVFPDDKAGWRVVWWRFPYREATWLPDYWSITTGSTISTQVPLRGVDVPLWIPVVPFAFLVWYNCFSPAHRRRKRKKLGLCVKCGYDLRGSNERCPECGQEFEKQ